MAKRTMAWSYSRLTTYERCPAQLAYRTAKTPEIPSPAMERGNRIHKDAEEYLRGIHKQVPATLQGFAPEFRELRKLKARAEDQIAVDEDWRRVEWFSPQAWLRIVIDARHSIEDGQKLIDFKTGNTYPDHLDQLELYALTFFKLEEKLRTVEGELWYLDKQNIIHDVFDAEQVESFEKKWQTRAAPLLTAKEFPATPGRHCNYCGFASLRGGPCPKDQER